MALAGDPPEDPSADDGELSTPLNWSTWRAPSGVSVSASPPTPPATPGSRSLTSDRRFLARKLKAADFAVTQFFFEPDSYFSLVDDLTARGLTKPVLPGIMPVTSLSSIPRRAQMGCAVPAWLVERLEGGRRQGGLETWPRQGSTLPRSYAFSCWTREHRACTSILSTSPRRLARSTPTWALPLIAALRAVSVSSSHRGPFSSIHVVFRQESTKASLPHVRDRRNRPQPRAKRGAPG